MADTIRLGTEVILPTMDPHIKTAGPFQTTFRAVFNSLFLGAAGGRSVPGLARSARVVEPTVWEFELQPDVRFHDGEPFTAETVRWNLERATNPENKLGVQVLVQGYVDAEVVDPLTLRVRTSHPDPIFPERMRLVQIVPQAYFEKVGAEEFGRRPSGTGMWRFVSLEDGVFVGESNPDSWQGAPPVQRLEMHALPPEERVERLLAGELDIADRLPATSVAELEGEGFNVHRHIAGQTSGVFFDLFQDSPVQDVRVRQALNLAFDNQEAIDAVSAGIGLAVGQVGYPDATGWDPTIAPWPHDPDRARALMAEAGYPDGFQISMHVLGGAGRLASVDMAERLQSAWREVLGVDVTLDVLSAEEGLTRQFRGSFHPMRLATRGYGDDVALAQQIFAYDTPVLIEPRRYRNDEFDAHYKAAAFEMDPERRVAALQAGARVLHEDAAMVFIGNEATIVAASPSVKGLSMESGFYYFWNRISKS